METTNGINAKMHKGTANIYKILVDNEVHSIMETPKFITSREERHSKYMESTYNLVLVDISASMRIYAKPLVDYWNELISPLLPKEKTEIYVFGSEIQFRGNDNSLKIDKFFASSTNIVSAIRLVTSKVKSLESKLIRVFLLTDGLHNATDSKLDDEIADLLIPAEKTVELFLLGFGERFPLEFSLELRSALHNGGLNIPVLFWAKCLDGNSKYSDILVEIESIADIIRNDIFKIQIDPHGKLAPGFPDIEECFLGEFIYFTASPDSLMVSLSTLDEFPLDLNIVVKEMDKSFPIDSLLRQWNSLILQYNCHKRKLPFIMFSVMKSICKDYCHKILSDIKSRYEETKTIRYRLTLIENKRLESKYVELLEDLVKRIGFNDYSLKNEVLKCIANKMNKIQFDDENEGIENQLKDYNKSVKDFKAILRTVIKDITKIFNSSSLSEEEECKITKMSMIKDIIDPSLPELLLEDKLTFMTNFTVTGMPVFISSKNSEVNPWMLCVDLNTQNLSFLVSQNTLEYSTECNFSFFNGNTVQLEEGYEIIYNAVVPILPRKYTEKMRPLISTAMFDMLCSFCIYRNPNVIDNNVHIAVLGCTWIKLLAKKYDREYSDNVSQALKSVCATATLYLDREDLTNYFESLISNPKDVLMLEIKRKGSNKEHGFRCESMVKPLFLLYLNQNKLNENIYEVLIPLILMEFFGRYFANFQDKNYKNSLCRFFLKPNLNDVKKREEFIDIKSEEISSQILKSFIKEHGKLLKVFYKPEDLRKTLREFTLKQMEFLKVEDIFNITMNYSLINSMKNVELAGDVCLKDVKNFVSELQENICPKDILETYFDDKLIFVYVFYCLQSRNDSNERFSKPIPSYEEALNSVKMVFSNDMKTLVKKTIKNVLHIANFKWREEYFAVHSKEIVQPMTKEMVLLEAQKKNVDVNQENFETVFMFDPQSGLLRNSCMVKNCPYYLIPNKSFAQHIFAEREKNFIHRFHKITLEVASEDGEVSDVISKIFPQNSEDQKTRENSDDYLKRLRRGIFKLISQYKEIHQ